MSDATFYKWRSKYGGMNISEAIRLRDLEEEKKRLKHLVANLTLNKLALEDMLKKFKL